MYTTKYVGSKYTSNFKAYILQDTDIISPFHDIPCWSGPNIHVINEIPRFENAKFEITKSASLNPIMQDTKKGKMRFVQNIFPFKGYPWNYGAIPQTFEDPDMIDPLVCLKGDNDPLDVIEIGNIGKEIGTVYEAKVLGALALIDGGECDWKIVAVDVRDELAGRLNDIEDVRTVCPGLLESTVQWFRDYKVPDGKGRNDFAFEGVYQNRDVALEVVREAHSSWEKMMSDKKVVDISKVNRTLEKYKLEEPMTMLESQDKDGEVDAKISGYYYVSE